MDPTLDANRNSSNNNSVYEEHSVVSDCESGVCGAKRSSQLSQQHRNDDEQLVLGNDFIKLGEGDAVHELIKARFVKGVGAEAEVVSIGRNGCWSVAAQARVQCFHVWERAVARLRGGNANVRYAWYGTRGEQHVRDIVSRGFPLHLPHPHSFFFSPDHSPLDSVKRCVAGKDGVRHLLLCRVILGRSEFVHPCKEQCNPSSEEYDSGVDSFCDPKKYILCSSRINTHVLPAYVISFRVPSSKVTERCQEKEPLRPSSPWMPFPTLISVLSKVLPPHDIALISMFHKDHKDKKISRQELIRKVRLVTGDKLLISAIKSYRAKKKDASLLQSSKNMAATGQLAACME